jgi:hypothetical protein
VFLDEATNRDRDELQQRLVMASDDHFLAGHRFDHELGELRFGLSDIVSSIWSF